MDMRLDLKKLCSDVVELVRRAADIMIGAKFDVTEKGDSANIVTTSDLAVQEFLCARLRELLPGCGFLGEEEHNQDVRHDYVWVVDPIDGTTNYARGIAECAISVGLVSNAEPVLGAVYAPRSDEMFSAYRGGGAFLNGKPIRVSDKPFESGLLCTAMSLYKKELAPQCFDIIAEAYARCADIRRFGSAALELCYLAAGRCDLYFEIRVFPWDYAGAFAILKEAGGSLTGLHGEELRFDKPTVLVGANNAENYAALAKIVSSHIKTLPYGEDLP